MMRNRRIKSANRAYPMTAGAPATSSWHLSPNPKIAALPNRFHTPAKEGYFSLDHVISQKTTTVSIPDYAPAEMECAKRELLQALRRYDEIAEIWETDAGECIDLWLLASAMPSERELDIYRTRVEIHRAYPAIPIDLHLLHLGMFEPDEAFPEITLASLKVALPDGAHQIVLG